MTTNNGKADKRKLWKQRIRDCKHSSLSAKQWCEKHQISYHSLKYWITKFNKERQPEKSNNTEEKVKQWVDIKPSKPSGSKRSSGIQVLIGQYRVWVQKDFDTNTFKNIVRILGQC